MTKDRLSDIAATLQQDKSIASPRNLLQGLMHAGAANLPASAHGIHGNNCGYARYQGKKGSQKIILCWCVTASRKSRTQGYHLSSKYSQHVKTSHAWSSVACKTWKLPYQCLQWDCPLPSMEQGRIKSCSCLSWHCAYLKEDQISPHTGATHDSALQHPAGPHGSPWSNPLCNAVPAIWHQGQSTSCCAHPTIHGELLENEEHPGRSFFQMSSLKYLCEALSSCCLCKGLVL